MSRRRKKVKEDEENDPFMLFKAEMIKKFDELAKTDDRFNLRDEKGELHLHNFKKGGKLEKWDDEKWGTGKK